MGSYSVGEALNLLMERSRWKSRIMEIRLREDWESIMGKTISRYTRRIYLKEKTLFIETEQAVLRQELKAGTAKIVERVNEYFGERWIEEVQIRG